MRPRLQRPSRSNPCIEIEVERPENWRGEAVDMLAYDGEVDEFSIEIEAKVTAWVDPAYGADRDGNRGVRMSGADVEDWEFTLHGDFRPWYIKWLRDPFVLFFVNFRRSIPKLHGTGPLTWRQLGGDYHFVKLEEKGFSTAEIEHAEEMLIEAAEGLDEVAYEDYCDRRREDY